MNKKTNLRLAATIAFAALSPAAFAARNIAIDAGTSNFPNSGQGWNNATIQTTSTQTYVLPFSVTIGAGSFSSICAYEQGSIGFGDCPGNAASPAIFAADNLNYTLNPTANSFFTAGAMSFSTGFANRGSAPYNIAGYGSSYCSDTYFLGVGNFDTAGCIAAETTAGNIQTAARVNWNRGDGTPAGGTYPTIFQILLLDASGAPGGSAGDFDFEINFAGNINTATLGVPVVGYDFNAQSQLLSVNSGNLLFQVRNGVVQNTSAVPEPGTLLLAFGALALVGTVRRRRTI